MRDVVVLGHETPLTPDFPLDDLPGGAGRLDVLARCVASGLLLSHDVRDDAAVHLVLRDELTVRFDGATVRHLNPDERSTAALIRQALEASDEAVGALEAEASPGVHVASRGLEATLDGLDGAVVWLHEDGAPAADVAPPADPVMVLSDHRDPTEDERALLEERHDHRVSLGPRALHAGDAVAVAQNWCDTDGFARYD